MSFCAAALSLTAALAQAPPASAAASERPNVLLIVLDDVGTDKLGVYRAHPEAPATPRLDALAAEGVLFRRAYATPLCSSTRAALLTGRHGRRTGVGGLVRADDTWELPLEEVTLPELLDRGGADYASAALGKWHLASLATPSGLGHPNLQGFDSYRGAFQNLYLDGAPEASDYFGYQKVVDGVATRVEEYVTTATTDDARAAVARLPEPWCVYVAYHAAHAPLHVPPCSQLPEGAPKWAKYDAMVTHLDGEIGRLLDGIPAARRARTLIVVVGDNGTDPNAVRPPRDPEQAKSTLYEGGIHVPLLVAGPGVARGGVTDALVHVVDLLPTVAEIVGIDPALAGRPLDGRSFAGVLAAPESSGPRRFVYSERFEPLGPGPHRLDWRAVRDERYKLLELDGKLWFFDLAGRADDGPARPPSALAGAERARFEGLQAELARVRREVRCEYGVESDGDSGG
jgi:arylsulfatase A-like enzyme